VPELVHRRARRRAGTTEPPSRKPAKVLISNTESEFYTLVDVVANDRMGLLHDVTRCIGDHDLEIYVSKVATIQDQVADTFYLKDAEGRKIRDPEALDRLQHDLLEAAEGPNEDDGREGRR